MIATLNLFLLARTLMAMQDRYNGNSHFHVLFEASRLAVMIRVESASPWHIPTFRARVLSTP